LIASTVGRGLHERISAQSSTIELRPSTSQSGATFIYPENAYDNSGSTASVGGVSRICYTDCTNPGSQSATWIGIPDGYHPIRLEVHWKAVSYVGLYGADTAAIEAKLEYSLDGGSSWSHTFGSEDTDVVWYGDSPTCSSSGVTCDDHVSTVALDDYQHTGQIQVRATLTAQLPHCDNCWIRISNITSQMKVNDIRVIADNCEIPIGESTDSLAGIPSLQIEQPIASTKR
jgi:hypothetical protein